MLFVRGATERNTERAKAPEKCATVVLESWRKWAWRDERKGRKKKTHQIRLLTAGIIHFCPRRLRFSAWLGEKKPSSAAVHLAHTGTPTSAWLKQTPLCAESWSWMGGKESLRPPRASLAYFGGSEAEEPRPPFPRCRNTLFRSNDHRPPTPKTTPLPSPHPPPPPTSLLPPSSSHPPTHTHTNIYNSPLPARNSQ